MYTHRTNSAILEAAEDNPGHTRVSAADAPRGCWVSVYSWLSKLLSTEYSIICVVTSSFSNA